MSAWKNLKIGVRLALGIGLVLALLLVIAGTAYLGLSGASDNFTAYRQLARETATAATWNGELAMARFHNRVYLAKRTDEEAQQTFDAIANLTARVAKEKEIFKESKDIAAVSDVEQGILQFEAAFKKVVDLTRSANEPLAAMDEVGPKIQANLIKIGQEAAASGSGDVSASINEILRSILMLRLYKNKFDLQSTAENVEVFRKAAAEFEQNSASVLATISNPAWQSSAKDAFGMTKTYVESFEKY